MTARRPRSGTVTIIASDPDGETARHTIEYEAHPHLITVVWSKNGYDGKSYEFKTNCDSWGPRYTTLEDCFLWSLTSVNVTGPDGLVYELRKDFNIQDYSGEVTQRWVLYGPAGAGFPRTGLYTFRYYIGSELEYEQSVPYTLKYIDYPTNVQWRREGNDLLVEWDPPANPRGRTWYKVILGVDTRPGKISQALEFGPRSARLPDITLQNGTRAKLNVAAYFTEREEPHGGGYAYSEYIPIVW